MAAENIRATQFYFHLHPHFSPSPPRQFDAVFFIPAQFNNYLTCFFNGSSISKITHPSFTFLFAFILACLRLKYQGKEEMSFDTLVTAVGMVSLLVYCLGYTVEQRFSSNLCYRMRVRKYVDCCMALASSVSSAGTASILFLNWIRPLIPNSIRPFFFVIFLVITAGELLHLLCCRIVQEDNRSPARRQRLPL